MFSFLSGLAILWLLIVNYKTHSRLKKLETEFHTFRSKVRKKPTPLPQQDKAQDLTPRAEPLSGTAPPAQDSLPARDPLHPTLAETPTKATQRPQPKPQPSYAPAYPQAAPSAWQRAMDKAISWITENWLFTAAAGLIALSGIFLIIYGVENGFITPTLRIVLAIMLGSGLIWGGEKFRTAPNTLYHGMLPAVFSGAGLVVLYGSAIAAHSLYGLISQPAAFVCLLITSVGALALGGRHHTFLTYFGLVGAAGAPLLVGNSQASPLILPLHYTLLTLVSYALGWYRTKPLIGLIGFGLSMICGVVPIQVAAVFNETPRIDIALNSFMGLFILFYTLTHPKSPTAIIPSLKGPKALWKPNRLSYFIGLLSIPFTTLLAFATYGFNGFLTTGFAYLLILATGATLYTLHSKKNLDIIFLTLSLPVFLLLLLTGQDDLSLPLRLSALVYSIGLFTVFTLSPATRKQITRYSFINALLPVGIALVLQLHFFNNTILIDRSTWAFCLAGAALAMMALTGYAAKLSLIYPKGFYAIASLGLMAHAFTALLDDTALTGALSGLLIAAAWIDGRLKLPYVSYALSLGIGALLARMIVHPGIDWALDTSWISFFASYGLAIGALGLLALTGGSLARIHVITTARTALAVLVPTTFTLFLVRYLNLNGIEGQDHWTAPLACLSFILSGFSLHTQKTNTTFFETFKYNTSLLLLGLGGAALTISTLVFNPIVHNQIILGVGPFTTLILAYLLPAILLISAALFSKRLKQHGKDTIYSLITGGLVLILIWIFTTTRYLWHGNDTIGSFTIYQGEHLTYTLLILAIGILTTLASIKAPSALHSLIRRIGLGFVSAAILKALFVDASDLQGLARVFSFLITGISLAGMAWVDKHLNNKTKSKAENTPV